MRTIRALRRERGWTQYELAIKVGVQPQTVYFWESGRRTPQVAQVRKLGQVFEISSDEILLEPKPTVPQVSSQAIARKTTEPEARPVSSTRQTPDSVRGTPQTRKIPTD
jgi:DNA-binding XRE family transcriptional regulator